MTTASAQAAPPTGGAPPIKRRLRNYLLDPAFQLKYTGMVVAVTIVVAGVLGYIAYDQSHAQTEMLSVNLAMEGHTADYIEEQAALADQHLLLQILGGIFLMVFSLGVTGILVTHRLVGPAFKMKSLFRDVSEGHLRIRGRLRKGDELKDVFDEFETMIEKLRARQRAEITTVEGIIARATAEGGSHDVVVKELDELRQRMEAELQTK